MNSGVWRGENRSDTRRYREDFQRGQAPTGAGLLIQTCGTPHWETRTLMRWLSGHSLLATSTAPGWDIVHNHGFSPVLRDVRLLGIVGAVCCRRWHPRSSV